MSEDAGPRTVLFTGFPGFIGLRLLPRLMELLPGAGFACLVQERFLAAARQGLDEIAAAHPPLAGRARLVTGDITVPGLGLAAEDAATLKDSLTSAYHLAAVYDLAVTREAGRRINVAGTQEVLRFLSECPRLRRLHYVSTCYVSGTVTGVFRETDLDVGQSFKNHYEETKFLAEVEVARSGLPVTTYRPSIVVGDSRTGETGKFDGPYFTLAAMEKVPSPGLFLKIGSGRHPANMVPIDFVTEALARLSVSPAPPGTTYHLADPEPLSAFEVGALFARELGKRFLYVPLPKGLAKVLFAPGIVQRHFGMPVQTLDYFDNPCRYDTAGATRDLAALGLACPRFADYVAPIVRFYREHRQGVRRKAMV
ncbi:MAG TPA: SDR family oxidoreductase [Vicinamibacteria bacterium]|nr:SDR family oxidoreductase [Vicinamibacteria bacterium]